MRHCQKQKVTESRILQKKSLPTCILRVTSLSGHGRFTALSQVSGKSHNIILLCDICDIRLKFLQSIDSSYRMHSIATRSQQLSSLILSGKYRVSSSVLFALSRPYWQSHSSRRWYKTTITNITMASLRPSLVFSRFESDYSRSRVHFILEGRDENVETAKTRELTNLHLGKISKTHGSKSHHGLRKWVCFNLIDL